MGVKGACPGDPGIPRVELWRPTEADCLAYWFLLIGQPSKEPDSGLRPELALGLSAYQVLAPDPSVLGEHMTSWLSLGME